jgi:hypothetical protein
MEYLKENVPGAGSRQQWQLVPPALGLFLALLLAPQLSAQDAFTSHQEAIKLLYLGEVERANVNLTRATTAEAALVTCQASLATAQTRITELEAEVARLEALLHPPPPPSPEVSIWGTAAPTVSDWNDPLPYELGVKFRSSVAGQVKGVRFYKSLANTGTHVGHLWSSTGTELGSVTFTEQTASGWQEARFAAPVTIDVGTVYVASVHMPQGHYAATANLFSGAVTVGPLTALADSESPNGVYKAGASGFPDVNNGSPSYWIDVLFAAGTASVPTSRPVGLAWDPPLLNADRTPCTDLAGYQVAWGDALGAYGLPLDVAENRTLAITVSLGRLYVAALAYDTTGNKSAWCPPLEIPAQ